MSTTITRIISRHRVRVILLTLFVRNTARADSNILEIDPEAASADPSHLEKLHSRARHIPGRFDITTAPGEGTQLRLHVSLH